MMPARVVLLGGSGQIGLYALRELRARHVEVIAVSRTGRPVWMPGIRGVTWLAAGEAPGEPIKGVEGLLSAGPLAIAGPWLGQLPDARAVVAFSTTSVDSKIDSESVIERRQVRAIAQAEEGLGKTCGRRGIPLTVLRPTLVYGCGLDDGVSLLASWIRRFGFMPLAGEAAGLRQPVHAEDLARAGVVALDVVGPEAGFTSPLVGGSTLKYRDMVVRIFDALDRRPRLISLPPALLATATALIRQLPGFPEVTPEMVRRQAQDLVFDDRVARSRLGIEPRPFRPGVTDFELPDLSGLDPS